VSRAAVLMRRSPSRSAVLCAVVVGLFLGSATSAFGWEVSSPAPSVIRIERESSDATGLVRVWARTTVLSATSSTYYEGTYDATTTSGWSSLVDVLFDTDSGVLEYYNAGALPQYLVITPDRRHVVLNTQYAGAQRVSLTSWTGTLPVTVSNPTTSVAVSNPTTTVAVSSLPTVPVSVVGTVSTGATLTVPSTLTVTPDAVTAGQISVVSVGLLFALGVALTEWKHRKAKR